MGPVTIQTTMTEASTTSAHATEPLIRRAPRLFAVRTADRAVIAADLDDWRAGLRELFRRGAVLEPTSKHDWQHAPDTVVTSDASLLGVDGAGPFVHTQDGFLELMTPLVEDAIKAAALRERWERDEPRARRPEARHR